MRVEELVVLHADWLKAQAWRYCTDRNDADDLAADTIYKILSRGRSFDPRRAFKPWALSIMANTFITQYNRKKCVIFTSYASEVDYLGSERTDSQASVRLVLDIIARCRRRSNAIEAVMLYARGYIYAEIAEMLGIQEGTVKSRVSNGRKMLMKALK